MSLNRVLIMGVLRTEFLCVYYDAHRKEYSNCFSKHFSL